MLEITAFVVISTLYIIPLSIPVYNALYESVMAALLSQDTLSAIILNVPLMASLAKNSASAAASVLYILVVFAYFIIIYLLFRFVIIKYMYVFKDIEIDEEHALARFRKGQRGINRAAKIIIIMVAAAHLYLKVYDIKLFMLCSLSAAFVYGNMKVRPSKEKPSGKEIKIEDDTKGEGNVLVFEWVYNKDPLSIEQPARFFARISFDMVKYIQFQAKDHTDNSPQALRDYVINGLSPEITELANQVKEICAAKNFSTYHQVSAVMAFQQSLKYVYDMDSKGYEEYIRYPLETLIDKEGDCDCHSTCAAAILYSMGYDVVLLRITLPDTSGHLAIAVEGADGIPGNFFGLEGRKYYYCEVTPTDNNSMTYRVGEMPDMPGANIVIVPVKKTISNV